MPSGGLPLQWVESQASVLLLTMLQHCSSQYDLHRLLQLLADVDKLLKSNGEMEDPVTSETKSKPIRICALVRICSA